MKVFALLAASTLAVASAQTPDCDIAKLAGLLASPDGVTCQGNSGYSVLSFTFPEGDVLKKLCAEPTWKSFLAAMTAAVPTECLVRGIPVKSTLIDKFKPACDALAGSGGAGGATTPAPGPTTAAPGPTTAKPDATTAKPEATTAKPEATTAKPEATTAAPEATTKAPEAETTPADGSEESEAAGSGSTDIEDVKADTTTAPAAKTAVPTPAPTKSSASSVAAAAGAIVVAVAASFF